MIRAMDIKSDIDFTFNIIGNGVECKVFDVGDNIVYKQFQTNKKAKFAFKCQQIGFENGIAPEVIGRLEYGYFSESAISFEKLVDKERKCWWKLAKYGYKELLIDKINAVFGIGFCDDHSGNIALTDNGDVVLIDFGVCGFRDTETAQRIADELDLNLHSP